MLLSSEIESEIDVLRTVYDSETELTINEKTDCVEIIFQATPHHTFEHGYAFVEATILFRLTNEFPDVLPTMEVLGVRGLGGERSRRLVESMKAALHDFNEEPSLVVLFDNSRDILDTFNTPEGNCCVCLESLLQQQDADPGLQEDLDRLLLLPCCHAFHKDCFTAWWNHQQQDLGRKEKELIEKTGAGALRLELPRKHHESYILNCPVCRADITIDDIEFFNLLDSGDSWTNNTFVSINDILSPQEIEQLRYDQEKWKGFFQSQSKKGGIVSDSPFILSLSSCPNLSSMMQSDLEQ